MKKMNLMASMLAMAAAAIPGPWQNKSVEKVKADLTNGVDKILPQSDRYFRKRHARNKTSTISQKKRRINRRRRHAMGDKKAFA